MGHERGGGQIGMKLGGDAHTSASEGGGIAERRNIGHMVHAGSVLSFKSENKVLIDLHTQTATRLQPNPASNCAEISCCNAEYSKRPALPKPPIYCDVETVIFQKEKSPKPA